MELLYAPEPFSPAFGEILYAVSVNENEKGSEINILDSNTDEIIGIKKVGESPVSYLNVADYVQYQIRINPLPRQDSGMIKIPERIFYSGIACQGWKSKNPHTAGIRSAEPYTLLRENESYWLGEGEQDEICWIAKTGNLSAKALFPVDGEDSVEIGLGNINVSEKTMIALVLNSKHLEEEIRIQGKKWSDLTHFFVEIYTEEELKIRIEYRIKPHNCGKIRMAWWNCYGGIDFYSFETVTEETAITEKTNTPDNRLNFPKKTKIQKKASTTWGYKKKAQWLAGMMAAPQVWMEENGTFIPVKIQDNKMTVQHPEKNAIEISFEYDLSVHF